MLFLLQAVKSEDTSTGEWNRCSSFYKQWNQKTHPRGSGTDALPSTSSEIRRHIHGRVEPMLFLLRGVEPMLFLLRGVEPMLFLLQAVNSEDTSMEEWNRCSSFYKQWNQKTHPWRSGTDALPSTSSEIRRHIHGGVEPMLFLLQAVKSEDTSMEEWNRRSSFYKQWNQKTHPWRSGTDALPSTSSEIRRHIHRGVEPMLFLLQAVNSEDTSMEEWNQCSSSYKQWNQKTHPWRSGTDALPSTSSDIRRHIHGGVEPMLFLPQAVKSEDTPMEEWNRCSSFYEQWNQKTHPWRSGTDALPSTSSEIRRHIHGGVEPMLFLLRAVKSEDTSMEEWNRCSSFYKQWNQKTHPWRSGTDALPSTSSEIRRHIHGVVEPMLFLLQAVKSEDTPMEEWNRCSSFYKQWNQKTHPWRSGTDALPSTSSEIRRHIHGGVEPMFFLLRAVKSEDTSMEEWNRCSSSYKQWNQKTHPWRSGTDALPSTSSDIRRHIHGGVEPMFFLLQAMKSEDTSMEEWNRCSSSYKQWNQKTHPWRSGTDSLPSTRSEIRRHIHGGVEPMLFLLQAVKSEDTSMEEWNRCSSFYEQWNQKTHPWRIG